MRTTFVEIENKHFINRDRVISVRYICAGLWKIYTDDGSEYETRDEKAIAAILYGDPNYSTTDRREPNAVEVFDEKETVNAPSTDWIAQAKAIIAAAYRKADTQHDDCWFICRDVYATIRSVGVQNYTIILRTSHIVNYADTVGSIIVNPITGEKKAAIKEDLTLTQKEAIDYLVAMLPTN